MKISFVIPAYNEESYLGACLESVLREDRREVLRERAFARVRAIVDGSGKGPV